MDMGIKTKVHNRQSLKIDRNCSFREVRIFSDNLTKLYDIIPQIEKCKTNSKQQNQGNKCIEQNKQKLIQLLPEKQPSMTLNLNQLYPDLSAKHEHFFSDQELQSMPYFRQLSSILPAKDLLPYIRKCRKSFNLISIKKGTVIYTSNAPALSGYFLCHGAVTLLIKKNNRQKLESYPKHILHLQQQRVNYLNEQFGIPVNLCDQLVGQFYEEKVMFKYLEYQHIYGQGYFGFGDLMKNGHRAFTAVATQDTVLLELDKAKFQSSIKELEVKKQQMIIESILWNVRAAQHAPRSAKEEPVNTSISQQLAVKLSNFFNHCVIRTLQKDEIIFRENQPLKAIYFILKGQIELTKCLTIQIPKKLIKDQNKPQLPKQIEIKVTRLSERSYLGDTQFFLHTKHRQFTATSIETNSILLQIQPMLFTKIISEFITFEKDLVVSAKQKFSIANDNYLKQKNKVVKLFMQQFDNIQNKKKEKIITNLLLDEEGNPKNSLAQSQSTMFEIFSKEGMFFRDTYEKLQGFQSFYQTQNNNKRAAIRKYKIESTQYNSNHQDQDNHLDQSKFQSIHKPSQLEDSQLFDTKEKLLYSPKRNINVLELMSSPPASPKKQTSTSLKENPTKIKRKKSLGKFHELQKDQAVFKRVLIKNGRFEQDKTTYKSNIVKPIVHPQFDDIIKQCMSRKNQVIRRAIGEKRNDLVKDTYQNTVETLKNKSLSISKFSNVGLTCKGTEQFKKKMDLFSKNKRKSDLSGIRNRVAVEQENLQACIGFNQPPKSSYQKTRYDQRQVLMSESHVKSNKSYRLNNTSSKKLIPSASSSQIGFGQRSSFNYQKSASKTGSTWIGKKNSPEKLVLLNHMMKPMTYSSVQY